VKLLFDENVSHKLVASLANEFPDSTHVRDIGLRGAEDARIWVHAARRVSDRLQKTAATSIVWMRKKAFLTDGPRAPNSDADDETVGTIHASDRV
jgi:hypothetical protein